MVSLWGKKEYVLVLSTPFSLFLVVTISLLAQLVGKSDWLLELYLCVAFILATLTMYSNAGRKTMRQGLHQLGIFLPVLVVIVIYHYFAGAFVDHGSDVFQHMVLVQSALTHMDAHGDELQFSQTLGTKNFIFHNIAALFSRIFDLSAYDLIENLSLAYSILWTIRIFYFSHFVVRSIGIEIKWVFPVCVLALFFYWTAFGINNFSFVRYYIGGPVILNYGVYLGCLILLIDQFKDRLSVSKSIAILILLVTALVIHPQEAILFISYATSIAVIILLYYVIRYNSALDITISSNNAIKSAICVALMLAAIIIAIWYLPKYRFDPVPLRNLGLLSDRLINWNILRPDHQFYTVLGWWGLYVYFLAALNFSSIKKSVILTAGLLIPLITVFNPVFSEAYMRLAYPQVLWRMLFALPLPVIAAYLTYTTYEKITLKEPVKFIGGVLTVIPLFIFLQVFNVGPVNNLMAKSPSLIRTPDENSYRHWIDMLEFIQTIDPAREVLTDPSTGYLVRSLTKHDHHGFKFVKQNFRQFNFEEYRDHPLSKYRGWLLIINQRDGEINSRLRRPYHIYPDIMKVKKHYGESLIKEISNHPERYKILWRENDISVYKIL